MYTTCPPTWTLEDLAGKPPEVGSDRIYDDGTDPVPCWKWASTATRAYVNFNINQIPPIVKVVTARLTWDPSSSHQHGATPSSSQPPHCFKRLFEATAPWSMASGTPGNLISDELDQPALAKGIATEQLRQVVQKWADTGAAFGFFFAPSVYAESLPGKENSHLLDDPQDPAARDHLPGEQKTFP